MKIKVMGGLGNQLFIAAFALGMIYDRKSQPKFDVSAYPSSGDAFGRNLRIESLAKRHNIIFYKASLLERLIDKWSMILIRKFKILNTLFALRYIEVRPDYDYSAMWRRRFVAKYIGYFQSEKYFYSNAGLVKDDLNYIINNLNMNKGNCGSDFRPSFDQGLKDILAIHLRSYSKDSVSIENVDLDYTYYKNSLMKVLGVNKDVNVIIVGNSIDDCNNLKFKLLVDFSHLDIVVSKSVSDVEDFVLLRDANYLIMSNSTFSWWAGYLGAQKMVICPKIEILKLPCWGFHGLYADKFNLESATLRKI
ncbi:MAG TPA: alpha-1,2-fucosyltransferase [Emticicia sp.]